MHHRWEERVVMVMVIVLRSVKGEGDGDGDGFILSGMFLIDFIALHVDLYTISEQNQSQCHETWGLAQMARLAMGGER